MVKPSVHLTEGTTNPVPSTMLTQPTNRRRWPRSGTTSSPIRLQPINLLPKTRQKRTLHPPPHPTREPLHPIHNRRQLPHRPRRNIPPNRRNLRLLLRRTITRSIRRHNFANRSFKCPRAQRRRPQFLGYRDGATRAWPRGWIHAFGAD
jgi:hypothetical protein